jgi:hypothetical protein
VPAPKIPDADAKIGAKIDFVAKRLAEALHAEGFTRRTRVLFRERGEGPGRTVQLIAFQGDKWNEGKWGKFTINLGVCFPALLDLQKNLPGLEWIGQHANPYDVAFGPGGFEGRLGDALEGESSPRWPETLKPREDFWVQIDARTDLVALSDRVNAAVEDLALPWLQRRSALSAFGQTDATSIRGPGPREQVLAAILAGNLDMARERLLASSPQRLASDRKQFDAVLALLQQHGVNVEGLVWADPSPHPMREKRADKVGTLRKKHAAEVEAYLAHGTTLAGREDSFLDAWVHQAAAEQSAQTVRVFPLWRVIGDANIAQRRALLNRLLERMPEPGPTVESTLVNVWATYENYHVHAWSRLAEALLDDDGEPSSAAEAAAMLEALAGAAALVTGGMTNDEFNAPIASAIRWLDKSCSPKDRFEARDQMRDLLSSITTATVTRSRARLSHAPSKELLGDVLADQLATLYTPESARNFDRLYTESPERGYTSRDRGAILTIKRWLRADELGHVPLVIESDDWGTQLANALQELEPDRRHKLTTHLEWFDETASSKPTKRWWAELDARRATLPDEHIVRWLGRTLPRFAKTELKHFLWAPGYLAFPGETSERVLIGLIHWAGRINTPSLVPALETVANAAFQVVPDVRVRAYSVGVACFGPLASLSEGRDALTRMRKAIPQKNVKSAIDKALVGRSA